MRNMGYEKYSKHGKYGKYGKYDNGKYGKYVDKADSQSIAHRPEMTARNSVLDAERYAITWTRIYQAIEIC